MCRLSATHSQITPSCARVRYTAGGAVLLYKTKAASNGKNVPMEEFGLSLMPYSRKGPTKLEV